jgi:hypothetical protein
MLGLRTNKSFKDKIPDGYEEAFKKVNYLFLHQTVYDPQDECLRPLKEIPEGTEVD